MRYKKRNRISIEHMAGIVPVAGIPLDFEMPWSDALIPIAPNYLAIERAVYECALAGCETIWIVCHYGVEPLIKKRIGEFIIDPVSLTTSLNPSLGRRDIGIYYVAVNPLDRDRRDSLAWSILYGANCAFRVSGMLTKWLMPEKFYCSFPYSIGDENIIWDNRKNISSTKKILYRHNGKTIKDGLCINFTFSEQDYIIARNIIKKKSIDNWKDKNDFILQEVFCNLEIIDSDVIDLPWHYDISSWSKYKEFLSSSHSNLVLKNNQCFIKDKRIKFPTRSESRIIGKINKKITKIDPDYLE